MTFLISNTRCQNSSHFGGKLANNSVLILSQLTSLTLAHMLFPFITLCGASLLQFRVLILILGLTLGIADELGIDGVE